MKNYLGFYEKLADETLAGVPADLREQLKETWKQTLLTAIRDDHVEALIICLGSGGSAKVTNDELQLFLPEQVDDFMESLESFLHKNL